MFTGVKNYVKVFAQKKGVAGLEVLMALVSMLFMIGILVMAYVLAGDKLQATDGLTANSIDVINDTTNALNTTTDFFPVFIIFGSLVVLVLLVVIIIRSVRGSGLTGGA